MNLSSKPFSLVIRLTVAFVLLAILIAVAGFNLAPNTPTGTVLVYGFIGLLVLTAGLLVTAFIYFHVMQFVLRKGGTDTQWLWFPSDPMGIIQLRDKAAQGQSVDGGKSS